MEIVNGISQLQGISFNQLAESFGTPLYIYNSATILAQYDRLKNAFSKVPVRIKYAAKALTNQAILELLQRKGAGVDVVSIQEVQLALKAGFLPSDIMFTPNCVEFSEIETAVALGVQINIDNLPFLERFGQQYGNSVPCCVRVNPHIDAGGNVKIMTGHKGSKFGISIEQIGSVYDIVDQYSIWVNGVHVHSGSDFKDADAFVRAAEVVYSIAMQFTELRFLDFGSGFKVAYKAGDYVTDIEELGRKMSDSFNAFVVNYGKPLDIWFEPGKFLVSESGYLLVQCTVIKETPACTFIGVNSGLNHLIRPMMYGAHHDIVNVSRPTAPLKEYHVVGYICETDTFGQGLTIAETAIGDLLVMKNAGAYGFSMSSNYNSRFRPAEVLIHNGKAHLIRQRETMDDLLRHQVAVSWDTL